MATPIPPEADRFEPAAAADWHDWLAEHHATRAGIWLVVPRRLPAGSDVTYENARGERPWRPNPTSGQCSLTIPI